MNELFKATSQIVIFIFKLILITVIMITALQTLQLNILTSKLIRDAEQKGYIDYSKYEYYVSELNLDPDELTTHKITPNWNKEVKKLGDRLHITLKKDISYNIFGQNIGLTITSKADGINQGYYGTGY